MTSLRMGRISFLNVLPIYHPLEGGILAHDFELVAAPPAILNDMMSRGELHVSSCSCIEYARHPDRYYLVRDLSIGSRGPVMSVLLLSRLPLPQLAGREILISGESHTSVALLKLLFREYFRIPVSFRTGNVSAEVRSPSQPAAFLAIGDEALRLRRHPDYSIRIDLAEQWREWTGLPFIFGLWVISAQASDSGLFRTDPGAILRAGRDWSLENMDVILDLTGHGCPLSREELRDYYQNGLFYTLAGEELEGLEFFYKKLENAGMIATAPLMRFY